MDAYLIGTKDHVEDSQSTMNSSSGNTPLLQSRESTSGFCNKFQRRSPDQPPVKRKSLLLSNNTFKGESLARNSLQFYETENSKIKSIKQITIFYMEESTSSMPFKMVLELMEEQTFEEAMKEFLKNIEESAKAGNNKYRGLKPNDFDVLVAKKSGSPNRDYPEVDLEQKIGKLAYSSLFVELKPQRANLDKSKKNMMDCETKIVEYEEKMERSSSSSTLVAEKVYGNSLRKTLAEEKKTSMISDKPKNSLLFENLKTKNLSNNTTFLKEQKQRRTCLFCYYQD